jgi:uncharacterized lipoprotein YajG
LRLLIKDSIIFQNKKNDNMKNKLFLMATIVMLATSCKKSTDAVTLTPDPIVTPIAQASVPAAVVNTFTARFPAATQVEWFSVTSRTSTTSSSESREIEVEFNHLNQRHEARFDDNGIEKHHTVSCIDAAVTQVVLNAFRTTHPNDIVYEWNLRADGTWKAHFMRGAVKWEATYTAAGVLVKEEQA